jgi:hypothetical protein
MKYKIVLLSVMLLLILLFIDQQNQVAVSNNSGAPAGHTGSPFDNKTCAKSGCHLGSAVVQNPNLISSNVPFSGYIPGTTYTITCTVGQTGINKYGFQISPMNNAGTLLGSLIITNPATTKIVSTKYVTHTLSGTAGAGTKTWAFNWVAPATGTGSVTFYGAFNYTNSSNSASGDVIHTSTLTIPESTAGITDIPGNISELLLSPNPVTEIFNVLYHLTTTSEVTIELRDINGKSVKRIEKGIEQPGKYQMDLSADTFGTGIYFITIYTSGDQLTRKVVKL